MFAADGQRRSLANSDQFGNRSISERPASLTVHDSCDEHDAFPFQNPRNGRCWMNAEPYAEWRGWRNCPHLEPEPEADPFGICCRCWVVFGNAVGRGHISHRRRPSSYELIRRDGG